MGSLEGARGLAFVLIPVASLFSQTQAFGAAEKPISVSFEGGQLTITQQEQYGEKVLAFDGKELARNYEVDIDRVVRIDDMNVALVDVGGGGNE